MNFKYLDPSITNRLEEKLTRLNSLYLQSKSKLENKVHPVPEEIDKKIAEMKLSAMEIDIDTLTEEQEKYLSSWQEGT